MGRHSAPDPPEPAGEETGTSREPLLTVGAIGTIVTAGLAVGVAFGLPLTAEQRTAILALVAAAAPLAVAAIGRGRVYAPATVRALLQSARRGPAVQQQAAAARYPVNPAPPAAYRPTGYRPGDL